MSIEYRKVEDILWVSLMKAKTALVALKISHCSLLARCPLIFNGEIKQDDLKRDAEFLEAQIEAFYNKYQPVINKRRTTHVPGTKELKDDEC